MYGIMYRSEDEEFIRNTYDALTHLNICPNCQLVAATPEGVKAMASLYAMLDNLSTETVDDIDSALQFCSRWLVLNDIMTGVDALLTIEVSPDELPN
jgi:hypothetical protein